VLRLLSPKAHPENVMNALNKILVPVDFSKHTDAAIETAIELASLYDASITLLNVFEPAPLVFPDDASFYAGSLATEAMGDLRKLLDKKKDEALAKGAKRVRVEQHRGNPVAAIQDVAEVGRYDLIVIGTLGRTGLARLLLGSVAERVVRSASCAVLTVHERAKSFAKILVPTDFSAGAEAALATAIDLAVRSQASITLVNVYQPIGYAFPTGSGVYTSLPLDHVFRDQLEALEALQQRVVAKGVKQVEVAGRTGHPPTEIRDLARAGSFDLIAMGTHGRSGMAHMLIGSVAERVVRTAPCPVLTIREGAAKG
jgi:nucleotide-binding universal stress UspA family protein